MRRLFRALRNSEQILTSNLLKNHRLPETFIPLAEVYSHIVPSYKFRESNEFRTVFSFTEDLEVAQRLLTKYPNTYKEIGYFDLDITNAFSTDNPQVLFALPVFDLSSWIELIAYSYEKTKAISNLNYPCNPIPFINAIVPSRWSALSLANSNKEYILVCDNLVLNTIDQSVLPNIKESSKNTIATNMLASSKHNKLEVIAMLKKQLEPLNITRKRKAYLLDSLNELYKYYSENESIKIV